MAEVIRILPGIGRRSPDAMLECAKSADLDSVVIMGWGEDGFFFSSSYADRKDILWDIERAKKILLNE